MASAKYDKVKNYYDKGYWKADRVKEAVVKGWITEEEANEIMGIVAAPAPKRGRKKKITQ